MTTIVELNDDIVKASLNEVIKELLNNPELELK